MPNRRVVVAHPSPDLYGSDRQLLESITGLIDDGWSVLVAVPTHGPLEDLLAQRGAQVRVVRFPVLSKSVLHPRRLPAFAVRSLTALVTCTRLLRRERAGLAFVNTITNPVWLAAAALVRVPALCHVHEAEDDQSRLVRTGLIAPMLLASSVVANSAAARGTVVRTVPRLAARTHVVHNGVPGPPEEPSPPRERREGDPLRLVVVGRLSPRKGTDVALEATALLRSSGIDAHLTLCGSVFPGYEWFEEQLRARAGRDDLSGAVTFAGYVHPTWAALADADVALVPSRAEPFGNVAVEAQLARRPVVVSRVQGLAEIVSDPSVGLSVPPDDPAALAAAVRRLAQDSQLARALADSGHESALRRFSVEGYRASIARIAAATSR